MKRYVKTSNSNRLQKTEVNKYIQTHKDVDHIWIDLDNNSPFGYSTKMEIENSNPGLFNSGGWYSFHYSCDDWANKSKNLYDQFFQPFHNFEQEEMFDDDLFYKSNCKIDNIVGSNCLVVGAGPTTNKNMQLLLDSSKKYDIKATCNHFYLNEDLRKIKFDYIFLSMEVDLNNPKLLNYIREHNPVVAFEHGPRRRLVQINDFVLKHKPNLMFYMTRYFSRLGYTSRQIVFLGLAGAKNIDFIGLDGISKANTKHSFQEKKKPPHFYDTPQYQRLGIIFWDYLLNNVKLNETNFRNLSDGDNECLFSNYKKMVSKGEVFI